jgi:hypothetical protein
VKRILYHYTTEEAFNRIVETRRFKPSTPWTRMDAAYGTGWYFTDLGPDVCDMVVAYQCWRRTSDYALQRVKRYLKFAIESSILRNPRKHVYMVEKRDERRIKLVGAGEKNDCPLKPCKTCKVGKLRVLALRLAPRIRSGRTQLLSGSVLSSNTRSRLLQALSKIQKLGAKEK